MSGRGVFDDTPMGKTPADVARRSVGGNSGEKPSNDVGGIAAEHLRQFVARIEKLEEEKKVIAEDIKEVYAEAKGNGFDTKTIRTIIRRRKKERATIEEEDALLELYEGAVGVFA